MRHLKFCYISILIYIYTSLVALLSYGRTYGRTFPIGLVKTESGFIVRSVETGLGR